MKVTKREKVLLIILCVVLLGFIYYKFIIKNQDKKIKALTEKKSQCEDRVFKVQTTLASKKKKELQLKALNSEIVENTRDFFPSIDQEKIIILLNEMFEKSKVEGNVLNFSEITLEKIENKKIDNKNNKKSYMENLVDEYKSLEDKEGKNKSNTNILNKNSNSSSNNANNKCEVKKMQVTVSFKSTYENLMKFVVEIETFNKKIIINNISISSDENGYMSGTILLDLYAVPKFSNEEYYKYEFKMPHGKENLFKGGLVLKNNEEKNNESKESKEPSKYDFYMSLRPTSSDLPTIILSKKDEKDSSIYADNNDIEYVEIYLTQRGDEYFYKYKTSKTSYPVNFKDKKFIPIGKKITLKVFSNVRNSDMDKAGSNLRIYNKTDLNVHVYVVDDDKNRPRLNVIKEGNVSVN